MKYLQRFALHLDIRLGILFGTFVVTAYLFSVRHAYLSATVLAAVAVVQAVQIARYVRRTNRELARFFDGLRAREFSDRFDGEGLGADFDVLGRSLAAIIEDVKADRSGRDLELRLRKAIVDQVPVPLLTVDAQGKVEKLNNAARRFFGTAVVGHLDALRAFDPELHDGIEGLELGGQALVYLSGGDRVLVTAAAVHSSEQQLRLFSLQSLRGELESTEVKAWQELVRVLTHELMNSLTPIRSLAMTAASLMEEDGDRHTSERSSNRSDTYLALVTVAKRAEGLLRFVESYRQVSRLPKPKRTKVRAAKLFARVERLFRDEVPPERFARNVRPDGLEMNVDAEQVEQALINLVRNALDAAPHAVITLNASIDARGRAVVSVSDDGPGVPEDVASKMFVPFFTTKREGSGVGLSLTRQIMRAHGGFVSFEQVEPHGARFVLTF